MDNLIKKYNVSVPRYTSYPPVPYWNDKVINQNKWLDEVVTVYNDSKSISLYIHLPYCESLCTYCACNKRITKNHAVEASYVDAVIQEWAIYRAQFSEAPLIKQIHLGGGTPTFFSPENLKALLQAILSEVEVAPDNDFSFEAHPSSTSKAHLETLFELGFKRISIGVQDISSKILKAINRHQDCDQIRDVCKWAREIGYSSINYDIIYGLPFQTEVEIDATVNFIKETAPDRIAFYSYAHVPWKSKSQRAYSEDDLPKGLAKSNLYQRGMKALMNIGYQQIGMDHFCLETDSLYIAYQKGKMHRNFMGYTHSHTTCSIGLGVSAISDCWSMYVQNEKSIEAYKLSIYEQKLPIIKWHHLNKQELEMRSIILELMCRDQLSWDVLKKSNLINDELMTNLSELEKDGLVYLEPEFIKVSTKGLLFIRNICAAIDPLYENKDSSTPMFSSGV